MNAAIIHTTAEMFKVHPRDLAGDNRFDFLTRARFAMFAALRKRGWSYSAIGRATDRDRTTVSHGVGRAADMMRRDAAFADKVNALSEALMPERRWQPSVVDIFHFICAAADADPHDVRRARAFDSRSQMLASMTMKVALDACLQVTPVARFFKVAVETARRSAAAFDDTWMEFDDVPELLARAQKEFSHYGVAIPDCACDTP